MQLRLRLVVCVRTESGGSVGGVAAQVSVSGEGRLRSDGPLCCGRRNELQRCADRVHEDWTRSTTEGKTNGRLKLGGKDISTRVSTLRQVQAHTQAGNDA